MGNYNSTNADTLEFKSQEINHNSPANFTCVGNEKKTYIINYNNELYYSNEITEIVEFIEEIREKYVANVLCNSSLVYKTRIYEQINGTNCNSLATKTQLENMFQSENTQDIYKLDITECLATAIISYETTIAKLRISVVPKLCKMNFEGENNSVNENEKEE